MIIGAEGTVPRPLLIVYRLPSFCIRLQIVNSRIAWGCLQNSRSEENVLVVGSLVIDLGEARKRLRVTGGLLRERVCGLIRTTLE